MAALVGLAELLLILTTIAQEGASAQTSPRQMFIARTVGLAAALLGGLAAYRLGRQPFLWAVVGVLCWGIPFIVLAVLAPAAPSAFEKKRMRKAVRTGDVAALRRSLAAGFPVDAPLTLLTRRNALMEAGAKAQFEAGQALVEAGADLNARDRNDCTPLMLACAGGSAPLVRLLLERGADPRSRGFGTNALGAAIHYGHHEVLALLLDAGASPADDVGRGSALSFAEKRGNASVLRLLRDREESTRLVREFEASLTRSDAATAVSRLKDVEARASDGRTPLSIAVCAGKVEVIQQCSSPAPT